MDKSKWIFIRDYIASVKNPNSNDLRPLRRTFKKGEIVEGENWIAIDVPIVVVDKIWRIPTSDSPMPLGTTSTTVPSPIKPYSETAKPPQSETITDKVKSVVPKNHLAVFAAIVGLGIAFYYFNKISS